jgi:DnaJ-class molecular chaperone
MGFGRSQFNDMHFSSQGAARARATVYSDDEYESMDKTADKRTKPMGRDTNGFRQQQGNKGSQQFWQDVDREEAKTKEDYAKKVWDEFDDFFEFSKQGGNSNPGHMKDETKGTDYKADVTIDFMDAFKGVKTSVEMNKRTICHSCKGTRAKQGSQPRKCFECGGRGTVVGNYGIRKRCKKCNGAGCIVRQPCNDCEGLGVQRGIVKEDFELPPGVNDGQKIKIKGLGHASDVF